MLGAWLDGPVKGLSCAATYLRSGLPLGWRSQPCTCFWLECFLESEFGRDDVGAIGGQSLIAGLVSGGCFEELAPHALHGGCCCFSCADELPVVDDGDVAGFFIDDEFAHGKNPFGRATSAVLSTSQGKPLKQIEVELKLLKSFYKKE